MAERQRSLDPANPTDTPLGDVVDALDVEGFDGQFRSEDGARVRCLTCQEMFDASTIEADDVARLEGVSDPADMTMVVPVTCPDCATSGTLVLGYGPDSSAEDADVVRALSRAPDA
jgi:hypothetical protein